MTNKIMELALTSRFPKEDISNIVRVASATGNAEVAIELLLGLYEEPFVPQHPKNKENVSNQAISCEKTGYDIFKDEVSFDLVTPKNKTVYYDGSIYSKEDAKIAYSILKATDDAKSKGFGYDFDQSFTINEGTQKMSRTTSLSNWTRE